MCFTHKKTHEEAAAKTLFRKNIGVVIGEGAYGLADQSEHRRNVGITGNDGIVGRAGFENIAKVTPRDLRRDTVDPWVPMGQRKGIIEAAEAVVSPANTTSLKEASGGHFVFGSAKAGDWIGKYDTDMTSSVERSADDVARDPLLTFNHEVIKSSNYPAQSDAIGKCHRPWFDRWQAPTPKRQRRQRDC